VRNFQKALGCWETVRPPTAPVKTSHRFRPQGTNPAMRSAPRDGRPVGPPANLVHQLVDQMAGRIDVGGVVCTTRVIES
jgi:hypothetical protein